MLICSKKNLKFVFIARFFWNLFYCADFLSSEKKFQNFFWLPDQQKPINNPLLSMTGPMRPKQHPRPTILCWFCVDPATVFSSSECSLQWRVHDTRSLVRDNPKLPDDIGEVPNPYIVVGGSVPCCEINSLLDWNLARWSSTSCVPRKQIKWY